MRLIIIRHGESESNRRDFTYGSYVSSGAMTPAEAQEASLQERFSKEFNGDTFLTDNGYEQARLLGEYWAPILASAARGENAKSLGKLHVFVSPMQRNLETVHPLMVKLRDEFGAGEDFTATVNPDQFEIPALSHPSNRPEFWRIMQLQAAGRYTDVVAAVEAMEGKWKAAGLTKAQMQQMFPWAVVPDGAFANTAGGGNDGWWSNGFEPWYRVNARMHRLVDWLEELSERLDKKDTVLMITHGDQTNRMLNLLFARSWLGKDAAAKMVPTDPAVAPPKKGFIVMDLSPKSNTSVSCLTMNPRNKLGIDFFHRMDHLGPETSPDTLMRGYQFMGLSNNKGERMTKANPIGYWGLKAPNARL